jgi:hypothetical protein
MTYSARKGRANRYQLSEWRNETMFTKQAGKILSLLLTVCLVFGTMPMTVFAGEDGCTHVHDETCGYAEAAPCAHTHSGDCGYEEETSEIPCDMGCEGGAHAEGCAYTPTVAAAPCTHQHGADCGYAEGTPCGHVHDENCGGFAVVDRNPGSAETETPDTGAEYDSDLPLVASSKTVTPTSPTPEGVMATAEGDMPETAPPENASSPGDIAPVDSLTVGASGETVTPTSPAPENAPPASINVVTATLTTESEPTVITAREIMGVAQPVVGATASYEMPITATDQYTGKVYWYECFTGTPTGSALNGQTFRAGAQYMARVIMRPTSYAYTFTGTDESAWTVAGATHYYTNENGGSILTLSVWFPALDGGGDEDTKIIPEAVAGINSPAAGAMPQTDLPETIQYRVKSITWYDNNGTKVTGPFADDMVFRANIVLEAKVGYTFKDLDSDALKGFTVNGKAPYASDTGTLEISLNVSFGAGTGSGTTQITPAPIAGIASPVGGAMPQTTVPSTSEYTATIQWSEPNGDTVRDPFVYGYVYHAQILLRAKEGYTFSGLESDDWSDFTVNNGGQTGISLINGDIAAVINRAV